MFQQKLVNLKGNLIIKIQLIILCSHRNPNQDSRNVSKSMHMSIGLSIHLKQNRNLHILEHGNEHIDHHEDREQSIERK